MSEYYATHISDKTKALAQAHGLDASDISTAFVAEATQQAVHPTLFGIFDIAATATTTEISQRDILRGELIGRRALDNVLHVSNNPTGTGIAAKLGASLRRAKLGHSRNGKPLDEQIPSGVSVAAAFAVVSFNNLTHASLTYGGDITLWANGEQLYAPEDALPRTVDASNAGLDSTVTCDVPFDAIETLVLHTSGFQPLSTAVLSADDLVLCAPQEQDASVITIRF